MVRSTRSSARLASSKPEVVPAEDPKEVKPKVESKAKAAKESPKKVVKKAKAPAPKKKVTAKKAKDDASSKETEPMPEENDVAAAETEEAKGDEKVVMIEASNECQAFKVRAKKIADGVGSTAKVVINQERPGKGNFVIRITGMEKPVLELKAMKRPFPPLKALDMDEVVKQVLDSLAGHS